MKINMDTLDLSVHHALRSRLQHEYGQVCGTNFLLETLLEATAAHRDALLQELASLRAENAELVRAIGELKSTEKATRP